MSQRFWIPLLLAAVAAAAGAEAEPARAGDPDAEVVVGGQVRVRGYSLENMWDLDGTDDADRWSVFRHRTRIFARADLPRGVRGFVRLANQHWGTGVTGAEGDDRWEADNKSGKVFVDAAWLELTGAFGLPLDARLGRQDLFYGGGLVICDGQPQLASTANYLDGARLRFSAGSHLDVALLYLKDQENARADAAGDDVTLSGVYCTRRAEGARASADLYLLRREDQSLGKDVRMTGARAARDRGAGLDFAVEAALQRGDATGGTTHEAFAADARLGWTLAGASWSPRLHAGFAALSGDDPATGTVNERWDVYYGGWPRHGDLLAWTYLNLGAGNAMSVYDPGYADGSSQAGEVVYGNLLMSTAGVDLAPGPDLRLGVSASRLRAHHAPGGALDIGTYWQLRARYAYTPQLTLSLYAALLRPGDAYGPGADDAHEIFWETLLTF